MQSFVCTRVPLHVHTPVHISKAIISCFSKQATLSKYPVNLNETLKLTAILLKPNNVL